MKLLISNVIGLSLGLAVWGDFISPETLYRASFNSSEIMDNAFACPRCRKNKPKGPKKRKTPPSYQTTVYVA